MFNDSSFGINICKFLLLFIFVNIFIVEFLREMKKNVRRILLIVFILTIFKIIRLGKYTRLEGNCKKVEYCFTKQFRLTHMKIIL